MPVHTGVRGALRLRNASKWNANPSWCWGHGLSLHGRWAFTGSLESRPEADYQRWEGLPLALPHGSAKFVAGLKVERILARSRGGNGSVLRGFALKSVFPLYLSIS